MANGQWPVKLRHALWSEATGKVSLDHVVTRSRTGARYGLATMLLAARGENLFLGLDGLRRRKCGGPSTQPRTRSDRPIGAYRVLRNGVYRRDFTNGVVLANPYASSDEEGSPRRNAIRGRGWRRSRRLPRANQRLWCW